MFKLFIERRRYGTKKKQINKKEREALRKINENIFSDCFFDDFSEPLIIGDNNPDSGETHYTDFVCSHCGIHENIPTHIVMQFEDMDRDIPNYMPAFACEKCGHDMYPTYFKGYTGKIYQYKFKG